MNSHQLANQIEGVIQHLRSRIEGTGKQQYDRGSKQVIEGYSHQEVLVNAIEEIDDALVYLAHLRMRLATLAQTMGAEENLNTNATAVEDFLRMDGEQ